MENQDKIETIDTEQVLINSEVSKFDYAEGKIAEFSEFLKLRIEGIEDKEGFKKVHESRMLVRDERIKLEKARKAATEKALKLQKAVNQKAGEYREQMEKIEESLLIEENKVESEKERLRQEKIKAEEIRVQNRISCLFNAGMTFNGSEYTLLHIKVDSLQVKELPVEQWDALLLKIDEIRKAEFEKQQEILRLQKEEAEKKEALRLEEELRLESTRREQEAERLRLQELNRQQEEKNKKLREESEQMEREHAEKMRVLREETEKVAKQAEELKNEKNKQLHEKRFQALIYIGSQNIPESLWEMSEEEFKNLCETNKVKFEEVQKKLKQKEDDDREEKRKTDERIRLREESLLPDKEKLLSFARDLSNIKCPEVESEEANEVLKTAVSKMSELYNYLLDNAENL